MECPFMKTDIALIHSTSLVLDPVVRSIENFTDRYSFYHLLDESLLKCMMEEGNKPELTIPWLTQIVRNALRGGVQGIIVTCSSLSLSVKAVSKEINIPLVPIDTAMYSFVLENKKNPVVLMTNPTNEIPAAYMMKELGREVPMVVCSGAMEALQRGDTENHDRTVVSEIKKLIDEYDGIILSQISMERVRKLLPEEIRQKVYSSLDFIDETIESMELNNG